MQPAAPSSATTQAAIVPARGEGRFPPDLHDARHLKLKGGLLLLWALVSFGISYFARDLESLVVAGWPLGYWVTAQGAVVIFIGIVVAYGWAMNRLERQDTERAAAHAAAPEPAAADSLPGAPQRHG